MLAVKKELHNVTQYVWKTGRIVTFGEMTQEELQCVYDMLVPHNQQHILFESVSKPIQSLDNEPDRKNGSLAANTGSDTRSSTGQKNTDKSEKVRGNTLL